MRAKVLDKNGRPSESERPQPIENSRASEPTSGEEPYRLVFERLPTPAWVIDRATLSILEATDSAVQFSGFPRETLLTMSFLQLIRRNQSAEVGEILNAGGSSEDPRRWIQIAKDGSEVLVEATWRPVPFRRVPAILLMVQSVDKLRTDLHNEVEDARVRFEEVSKRLVDVQEQERASVAREIHDEIGQLLTGLKLMLAASGARAFADSTGALSGASAKAREDHEEIVTLVNELIRRLRDLSMDLRPPMLEQVGLVGTLKWHFERYTARTGVQVRFHPAPSIGRLASDIEMGAFRIIQEALTNVARHACVERVDVRVELEGDGRESVPMEPHSLKLAVEDQGAGFFRVETGEASVGLTSMAERARLLGGYVTIESIPGAGTKITATLPLRGGGAYYGSDALESNPMKWNWRP